MMNYNLDELIKNEHTTITIQKDFLSQEKMVT